MPTEQQLLDLEKAGALTDRELAALQAMRAKGAIPGPSTQSAAPPTPSDPSFSQELLGGAKALVKEPYYKTFVRPSADVNRLGYSIVGERAGFEEPKRYKERQIARGRYGAERLPEDVPHGWLEHLGAAASPAEAGLLTTPAGRVIFGLGTVTGAVTKDDDIVDTVEGAGGLTLFARDMMRAGKLLKRKIQWPFTPAEKAYVAAKEEIKPAAATAQKAQDAANAVEAHVADSKAKATAVARAADEAAQDRLDHAELAHKAALDHVGQLERDTIVPTQEIRDKLQLTAGGPTAERAGRMLQAVEDDATAMSSSLKHPVGAADKAIKLTEQSEKYKAAFSALGDKIGVKLPAGSSKDRASASMTVVRRRGIQYLQSLIEGQGTVSEKAVAREVSMLGVMGIRDLQTGEIFKINDPSSFHKMMKLNPHMTPIYEDVPLGKLVDLYTKAREVGLSPREFPVSQKAASRRFSRVVNSLRTSIGALADASPELRQSYLDWQRHVRRVENPFIRETATRILAPGVTPRKAFDTLLTDDPTTIERYFAHAKGPEKSAITHAIWNDLIVDASKGENTTDYKALAKRYKDLPQETKQLISSWGNGAAKMVMDEAQVRLKALEEGKIVAEEAKGGIKAVRRATAKERILKRRWNEGLKDYHREILDRSAKDVQLTVDALAKAQTKAERLGSLKVFAPTETIKHVQEDPKVLGFYSQGSYRMFAKAHVVMGIVDMGRFLTTGDPRGALRAVVQGGEALMFRRNKLVREALETPITSPRGREVALALWLMMKPFLGRDIQQSTSDSPAEGQFRNSP